jgi:hypothetical protein
MRVSGMIHASEDPRFGVARLLSKSVGPVAALDFGDGFAIRASSASMPRPVGAGGAPAN